MFRRRQHDHVGENVVSVHRAERRRRIHFGPYDEFLAEQPLPVGTFGMGADRQNVVLESFAPVEILAAAHVDFRIEQRGRGCDADCRVGDKPRVTTWNRRFGQIFQIGVLFKFDYLCKSRIVVAHLGKFSRRTS